MKIEQKRVSHFQRGRENHRPIIVVVHIGEGLRHMIYSEFLNKEKSSHYLCNNDGTIWQFVSETDTAWGNGIVSEPKNKIVKSRPDVNPNLYTISIENEGNSRLDIDEEQYNLNAELVYEICQRWLIPIDAEHIIGHRDINSLKTCPGKISVERIINKAKELETKQIKQLEETVGILTKIINFLKKLCQFK